MLTQTPPSPIQQALAEAVVAAGDRPISSVSLIAPLSHGHARLLVSWAGMEREAAGPDAPEGVTAMVWSRHHDHVVALPPMTAPESAAIGAAWSWGAWDIVRTCYGPGYDGALPGKWGAFAADLRSQGWVVWTFRPMMGGPEIRAKAHSKADLSLHPITLGRHEAVPDLRPPPLRPGTQNIIRLGRGPTKASTGAPGKRVPPATSKQIGLIRHLRREAGLSDDSHPDRMTIREASAEIERLKKDGKEAD